MLDKYYSTFVLIEKNSPNNLTGFKAHKIRGILSLSELASLPNETAALATAAAAAAEFAEEEVEEDGE